MSTTLIKREQLTVSELFEHLYFFSHFSTRDGVTERVQRKDRERIVLEYKEKFGEFPMLAIKNFFSEIVLWYICKHATTHLEATTDIQSFINADTHGFFLQADGRTNTERGEFALAFYKALLDRDEDMMKHILNTANEFEHRFDRNF